MNQNNIVLLQKKLDKLVKFMNHYYCDVWESSYPISLVDLNLDRKISRNTIDKVNKIKEFVLYIHIPFCISKCDYCTYNGGLNINKFGSKNYIDCLKAELKNILKINNKRKILSIFIGGGTPNLLAPNDLKNLLDYIHKNFNISKNAHIVMEVAPNNFTKEMAKAIVESRITKVILGVQTFNEKKLKLCSRSFQKNVDVYEVVKNLEKIGFKNISFDLIYGLTPKESVKDFLDDNLKHVLKLKPKSFGFYPLQHYQKFPETIYNFPVKNIDKIQSMIYYKLGIKKDDIPRYHSQYFYFKRILLKNIIAIGYGGNSDFWIDSRYISRRKKDFSQNGLRKYRQDIQNRSIVYDYYGLSREESLRRYIIYSLHSRYGLNKLIIQQQFPQSVKTFYDLIDNIKDFLIFSKEKIFLKDNYEKLLPFKTKNEYVNYFILSFCYLYSNQVQKKLLNKVF